MDKVIATLHSVEERAQHIMDATANEKLSLKEYIEAKKRAYEKKVNDATDLKLSELSAALQQQFDNEFNEKKSETEKFLNALSGRTYLSLHVQRDFIHIVRSRIYCLFM